MSTKKKPVSSTEATAIHGHHSTSPVLFTKDNYIWMIIGGAVIALGMILMSGGKNPDPNVFNTDLVYSFRRITVAPILILLGIVIEIYAIFKKGSQQTEKHHS